VHETLGLVSPKVPEPKEGRLLTLMEVAEFLSVTDQTVRKWCVAGRIPYGKIEGAYRIDPQQLQEWVDARWHSASTSPDDE
jgi:excisionase family DNA binding protein